MKRRIDQQGFAIVEVVVLVIIVALVLGGFWYINYASKTNKSRINNAIQQTGGEKKK